jgi:RHS repeat-associated protein
VTDTPFTPADDTTLASVTYTVTITNAGGITQPTRAVTNLNYKGVPVSNAKLLFIHPDVKGSPLMATDAAGNVLWREDYSAFGVRRKNEARANDGVGAYTPKGDAANSLWYIGKPQDNATGLVYFGARWYDPQVGRFMGFDPAGVDEDNPHSFNRYAYGNNNPYKYLDPDGNQSIPVQAFKMHADKSIMSPDRMASIDAAGQAQRAAERSNDPVALQAAMMQGAMVFGASMGVVGKTPPSAPAKSPSIQCCEIVGKSATEVRQLAQEKGLVPHSTRPDKWMDPVTGKERLRLDPGHIDRTTGQPYRDSKAAVPHHHAYQPDGKTKIVDPKDNNPHFPTAP